MITQEQLKQFVIYDEDTGTFIWKPRQNRSFNTHYAGKIATKMDQEGYLFLIINKKKYRAHRMAWLYVYGSYPVHTIDHLNFIKTDNRIVNLQDITNEANAAKQSPYRQVGGWSDTGVVGVYKGHVRKDGTQMYRAYLPNHQRIGYFPSIEQAIAEQSKYQ